LGERGGIVFWTNGLVEASERDKGRVLSKTGSRKLSVKLLDKIASGETRCNLVEALCKNCTIAPEFGVAPWVKVQIVWSATAFCWDALSAPPPAPRLSLNVTEMKREAEQWRSNIFIAGIQALNGIEPSICSVSWELSSARTVESAQEGIIQLIKTLWGSALPDDLRLYANYGKDVYADGAMNTVFQSRTHDETRTGWATRFLRPKPILGGRVDEIERLATSLGFHRREVLSECRTASGGEIGVLVLAPEHIQQIAASETDLFVHRTPL
jgi:hypothetical protein